MSDAGDYVIEYIKANNIVNASGYRKDALEWIIENVGNYDENEKFIFNHI